MSTNNASEPTPPNGAGEPTPPVSESWIDTLPEDIKGHPSLQSFKGVGDLAKSWVEAQKLIGKEKIPVPTGLDDKETWETVFNRLGRPEDPKEYKLPDDVPEEIPVDESFLENFKVKAHEIGLLPHQVEELFNWWVESEKGVISELNEMAQEEMRTAEAALRKEWGNAFEQNVSLARQVIQKFAGDKAQEIMSSSFGNDPEFIKLFANIGKAMSEDKLEGVGSGSLVMTPDEAKREIAKIRGDKKHAFYDTSNPEHGSAVEHMQNLYKMAYPDAK